MHRTTLTLAALALMLANPAAAQAPTAPAPGAVQAGCLEGLTALDQRMEEDGFWLAGFRASHGWTGVSAPPGTQPNLGGRAPALVGSMPAAGATTAGDQAGGGEAVRGPFAGMNWSTAPAQALRTLFGAAQILAQAGREEPCRVVLAEAERGYDGFVAQLRAAGVQPAEIRSWRQKQLLLARPVAQSGQALPADAIEGTDVRSPRDEYLGQIADVVIDPASGETAWAVISRGGFLGLRRDHVAVPWQALRVTPGLDTFVLDATRRQIDGAPRVDRASLATPEGYARQAGDVRQYWDAQAQRSGGGG
jgi:sporulation protein YlmC with PRC-barrel domain